MSALDDREHLPREAADRITGPMSRFLKIESASGGILLLSTIVALVLSNSALSGSFFSVWDAPAGVHFGPASFTRSVSGWVNDGLMTLFFFVVALELKREIVHGDLRSFRIVGFSIAGALGGMIAPAILFVVLMRGHGEAHAWGTVTSSDTALVVASLALLGRRVPASLRVFLLSLSIFDDIGAILVVAVGYGAHLNPGALALACLIVAVVFGLARAGVRSGPIYVALGLALWLALDASGVHPTLAGVVLGLMTPAREWVSDERLRAIFARVLSYPAGGRWSGDTANRADLQRAGVAAAEALSPVERLEIAIHPWSAFLITPIFALANAGVVVTWTDVAHPVAAAVLVSLVVGKPLGVMAAAWLAVRAGLATAPPGVSWSLLAAGCALTGMGFTMSLLIADLAFDPGLLASAKIGVLGSSIVSGTAGIAALTWISSATTPVAAATT